MSKNEILGSVIGDSRSDVRNHIVQDCFGSFALRSIGDPGVESVISGEFPNREDLL